MVCVKCNSENTKCVDDMLQVNYIAEIYVCNDCEGTIEVVYSNSNMSRKSIKEYKYITA